MLDWSKLKPYKSDCKKSFEELCFQIANENYKNKGDFTSIDDSGGGDGVEFYLTLPNGDEWGWQAKFFGGDGRLNEGGRKEQIKQSLQTAYRKHPNLKKWYFCSKGDFTSDESLWFSRDLPQYIKNGKRVLPEDSLCKLIHWGDRQFNNFLRKYPDIERYFFNNKILNFDWFRTRFDEVISLSQIKAKYESQLHIRGNVDNEVIKILAGPELAGLLNSEMEENQVNMYNEDYKHSIRQLMGEKIEGEFKDLKKEFIEFIESKKDIIDIGITLLVELSNLLSERKKEEQGKKIVEFENYIKDIDNYSEGFQKLTNSSKCEHLEFKENENSKIKKIRNILFSPFYAYRRAFHSIKNTFTVFELFKQQELHISGDAGMGKTHVAISIYEKQINQKLPCILLFGKNFSSNDSLINHLKKQVDIPTDWTFDDFLSALNRMGESYNSKVPIIIDGMNESIYWREIFKDNLEELFVKIKFYSNLVLITTYRSSYEGELFPKDFFKNGGWKRKIVVNGFEDYGVDEAIKKYTEFYKIDLKNYSQAINEFKKPLFLKIFCEAKKGKTVSFQNEDLFNVFEDYLERCNENIITNLSKGIGYNKSFTLDKLKEVITYLWDNNLREMPLKEIKGKILKDDELISFEGENLLISRNWNEEEKISFTYDLLGGYLIAKEIVSTIDTKDKALKFIISENFSQKLLNKDKQHPLYDDILRCFCVLLIKEHNIFLLTELENEIAKKYSIESLFEIDLRYIQENEKNIKKLLKELFMIPENRKVLFNLSKSTEFNEDHPLNFNFFSDLLKSLSMAERDLFWSEYIRENYVWYGESYFSYFVLNFEDMCKEKEMLSDRIHIFSKKVMWVLTTNIRKLRDLATCALYYYARRFPNPFLVLLNYSLDINDTYVPERMMAVSYGYAMFIHNNRPQPTPQEIEYLSKYGKLIYENIFDTKGKNHTTHLLMRDYAKRFLDITLKYNPNLLSQAEKELLVYPLKKYPHTNWGQSEDKDEGKYREGNQPIQRDFENYTIGGLIKGRSNYSSEPVEYRQVVSNIYWRIYDLGYSLKKFGDIDKQIANQRHYSTLEEPNKIDRYGKKYSWIAYYEMVGCRSDLGLLKGWDDEDVFRISDVDIDPSFPIPLKKFDLKKSILKDSLLSCDNTLKWINVNPFIVINKLLEINNSFDLGKNAEWVLIKGTISQKGKENQNEDVYIAINGVILDGDEIRKIDTISNKDYSFENIVPPGHYQLYEGELIWSDLMPYNEKEEIAIIENENIIIKKINFVHSTFMNNWESYHSAVNNEGSTIVLSKQISEHLKLKLKPQSSDLYYRNGELCCTTFTYGKSWDNRFTLTYVRKDLLQKYLSGKNENLVWFKFGDKRFFKNRNTFHNIEKFER